MATYTVQTPVHSGTAPTWVTPAASGDLAPTGPANYLLVFNGQASGSITVTLPIGPTYDGLTIGGTGRTVTVAATPAPGLTLIPLPSSVYGTGTTTVNYSSTTTVSVCVIGASVS